MTPTDAGQAKPSSRSDSDVNTRLIEDLRRKLRKWLVGDERSIVGVDRTGRLVVNRELLYRHPNYKRQIAALKRLDAAIAASRSTGAADVGEEHG